MNFSYAPASTPTELQTEVFGAAEVGAKKVLTISFNQTFEAKRKVDPDAGGSSAQAGQPEPATQRADSMVQNPEDPFGFGQGTLPAGLMSGDSAVGPQSVQEGQKVTLLALRTTAVTYDFERAAEEGDWLFGVTTTRLSTRSRRTISGVSISPRFMIFSRMFQGSLGAARGREGRIHRGSSLPTFRR